MAEKLHLGEFKIKPETKETVWMDRKRLTVFALPISFTIYRLSPSRINIQTGLLNTREEEIMLYRVRDVSYSQGFFERLSGTGTVIITSTDATTPAIRFEHAGNSILDSTDAVAEIEHPFNVMRRRSDDPYSKAGLGRYASFSVLVGFSKRRFKALLVEGEKSHEVV